MSTTITVSREFRLDDSDPTIIQTRTYSTGWTPWCACIDADTAFHTLCALRLREARTLATVTTDGSAAEALIASIWPTA